jgi:arylsulfatase
LAELLKPLGYMTAQIGKNHLGDRNEFLPTVHGFDEFFGNLYHLNAEEEPEQADYPSDHPAMEFFKPRGVLDCKASDVDDPTEDARFGRVGRQVIEDTGPLTRKRMETVEDDLLARSLDFIDRAHAEEKPFFLWHNSTRMHVWTRLSERWRDKTKYGLYADGMQELDWVVGELLGKLDELGIAEDTIVIFVTDNGAEKFTWPDGGTSPFRGEKGLGWEGGFRAPCVIRWPAQIPAGQILNGIVSLEDVVPTVMAAAGVPDVKEQLREGYQAGDKSFRVHLDGYNQLPYFSGQSEDSARDEFFYYGEHELYRFATEAGRSTSRSRTTGSAASRCGPRCHVRSTFASTPSSNTWTRPATRSTSERSSGRSCPPVTSSSSTRRPSPSSRPARHQRTSTPRR